MVTRDDLIRLSSVFMLSAGLCGFAASCGNEKPAVDSGVKFGSGTVANANPVDDMPVPPKDAQYTLYCRDFNEPTHVQDSRDAQHMLAQSTSMKKWYVVHSADHSTLYYGFYRCIDSHDPSDGAEGQRAINDLNTIRQMQDSDGNRVFSASLPVPIDSPDPQANPAWDIARTNGYWSIEIGTFANTPDRKQRAVNAVRDARADGVEAYYYHGPTASSVCIGCWPQEAAIEITPDQQNTNPDLPLLVTNTPMAPEIAEGYQKQNVQTAAPRVDVQDPTLTHELSVWKEHSVNGFTLKDEKPFLFKIPHKDPLDTMTPADSPTIAPPTPNTEQHAPGVGQLRSVGD